MSSSNGDGEINGNGKRSRGAPKGSQNHLTHGLAAFQNRVKRRARRGRSVIDRRSAAGKNAVAIQAAYAEDLGGEKNLSTAQLVLLELVGRDVYFLEEIDKRIVTAISVANTDLTDPARLKQAASRVKFVGIMYHYRTAAANGLKQSLQALGLQKVPPPQKSLQEILAEDEADNGGQE